MFYLVFIGLIAPWKEACTKTNNNYMLVESVAEEDTFYTNGPTSLVSRKTRIYLMASQMCR
jgi:solute carrier family 35, member F5